MLELLPRHSHAVPSPVVVYDPSRSPIVHNGESRVWELLQQVKGAQSRYEPILYPKGEERRGMQPDFFVVLQFYRVRLHIEITDATGWGSRKRQRMQRIEEQYRVPVLFINRAMLRRLNQPDALDVLYSWMYYVVFKDPSEYGSIISPRELFQAIGEEVVKPRKLKPNKAYRQQRLEAAA